MKVSYGDETRWCHVGQETIRKQFPAAMKHDGAMSSLSFRAKRSGAEKSPGEKFPMEVKHGGAMSDRKLYANSFLV